MDLLRLREELFNGRALCASSRLSICPDMATSKKLEHNAGMLTAVGGLHEFCSVFLTPVRLIGLSYYELVVTMEDNLKLEIGINIEDNKMFSGPRSNKGAIVMDW